MKKIFVSVFCALIVIVAIDSCGNGATEQVAHDSTPDKGLSGEEIYSSNCVICHGKDGTAGLAGATDLSKSILTHEQAMDVVLHGRNGMRAFSELSGKEIDAVVSHIETLRK